MQMTALKAHRYGNKQQMRRPGDVYEVRPGDVRLVKAMGWARETPAVAVAPATPARHDLVTLTAEAKPKRAYRRRDMTAEA
jgi:hypothetical protein